MTPPPRSGGEAAGPALGPILCGTVTVADLDEATRSYTRWLGWDASPEGAVGDGLAEAWSAPRVAGSRYRIVSPGAGRPGGVRLVERDRPLERSPLNVPGWRSIELVVSDVDEVRRRLDGSPFRVVGEPKALEVSPSIRAMQAVGPGREMLYLTQTSDETVYRLPRAQRLVDHMFIAVLSTPDAKRSFEFYRDTFGAQGHLRDAATALEAVNRELGLPIDRKHRISALQLAERSLVEIDEHPPELADETPPAGDLPGGLACVTFAHRSLDEVRSAWLREPDVRDEAPYLGRRATVILGPAGERIELVERSA
jgi:catechol 2,3-dioxygenase-like lactoylglutathione lyase family enzyme